MARYWIVGAAVVVYGTLQSPGFASGSLAMNLPALCEALPEGQGGAG
jgi:hypothetical protein